MSMAAANMFTVFPFGLLAAVLGNPVCWQNGVIEVKHPNMTKLSKEV